MDPKKFPSREELLARLKELERRRDARPRHTSYVTKRRRGQ